MKRIVILISGRGSNMRALFEARLPGKIVAVISNNPVAPGLHYARQQGTEIRIINHRDFADRDAFDTALANEVNSFAPDLVVLAGFMRILTEAFVLRFAGRILNIHPSLLPAFPGVNTHQRALDEGVRLHGCTVHFVTTALDHGPIVIQAAVPVLPEDDEAALAARVLEQEHHIFPLAARWFLDDRITLQDGRVRIDSTLRFPKAVISPNGQN
ncbi:MAG: phosphoribosylglycinamide formyltransferase [Betaproteobacteria bacterium]|nr:MAG: phosphoribosylglycinamide formyltransferase [Betaproteobacteria bacterium]